MANRKTNIAILFGGKSAEHEVSINSAKNVYKSIDKNKYDVILIGITKKGQWYTGSEENILNKNSLAKISDNLEEIMLISKKGKSKIISAQTYKELSSVNIVFPVLHGPFGEDGSMQGFLKTLDIPFVGSGVLGSALGMDKDIMKRLFRDADLPIANFCTFKKIDNINFEIIKEKLDLPVFIKPANLGSSVGVSKAENKEQLEKAISKAFLYDNKIIIEENIKGKEIECAVLGNENLSASKVGEIIPKHDFYDYDAKYLDPNGAVLKIPAEISEEKEEEIQNLAILAFKTLCLSGMARVDFFLTEKGEIYLNEVNTIPGFTDISMYPKLWEQSGLSNSELVSNLISLALEKYQKEKQLK